MKNLKHFLVIERRTIQVKRKYGQYASTNVGANAPVRQKILGFISEKGSCCKSDLMEFIKSANEESGRKTTPQWVKKNSRYLKTFEKDGETHYKLSKLGQRVIKATTINESCDMHDEYVEDCEDCEESSTVVENAAQAAKDFADLRALIKDNADGEHIYSMILKDDKKKIGPLTKDLRALYNKLYRYMNMSEESKVNEGKSKPTDATIKLHINQYSVSDDPYDVASKIGKNYNWTQNEIEKAESIIRKKYIRESKVNEGKTINLKKLFRIAKKAGNVVIDAKDALIELGVAYGENIPVKRVNQVLTEYDLTDMILKESINERKTIDSPYLQRQLEFTIKDIEKDEPDVASVLDDLSSRLAQSYPQGDVDMKIISSILKEPNIKKNYAKVSGDVDFYLSQALD